MERYNLKIVELKDANEDETIIKEINSGIYIFDIYNLFSRILLVNNNNNQNEYYLTDVFIFMNIILFYMGLYTNVFWLKFP